MSPQRKLSWIMPSLALFFLFLVDFHRVSLEGTFTDFALNGFVFSTPNEFLQMVSSIGFRSLMFKNN